MSTLTSNDVYGLMEAYQAVYAPQELTEEQLWEEVEIWVNDLLEEGYDLSDYTWEEMYEAYIVERGAPTDPKAKAAYDANVAKNRAALGNTLLYGNAAGKKPEAPITRNRNVRGGRTIKPTAPVAKPAAPSPAKPPAAPTLKPGPGGNVLAAPAPRNSGTRPPSAPATRPAAVPAKPAGTTKPPATTTPAPATPSAPARPSLSSQVDDLKRMRARSLDRQGKPLSAATVASSTTPAFQANSFDVFDAIKGHLIDEGYADTEEAALVIMSNMSEEWRESIVESQYARENPEKYERSPEAREGRRRRSGINDPDTGINSPAFQAFMAQQMGGKKKKKNNVG